jgi:hypothetical protein
MSNLIRVPILPELFRASTFDTIPWKCHDSCLDTGSPSSRLRSSLAFEPSQNYLMFPTVDWLESILLDILFSV